MPQVLLSKKVIVSVLGILVVFVLALSGRDPDMVKWVGGFVAGIVSTLNVSQGFADGLSRGKTSLAGRAQKPGIEE